MPVSLSDLEQALRDAIPISHLEIIDQSSGCGENYAVFIVSEAFEGKMTLARHRMINELLKDQIAQMHAFSQKTLTPKQYAAQLEKEKQTSE
ncbi:bola-like protein [Hysterangium stoloniferum]|nr:bola-like protein [Hysterangium stoloniferum]